MSVVSFNEKSQNMNVFCKGAPEIIKSLCNENSVPENYDAILKDFSE